MCLRALSKMKIKSSDHQGNAQWRTLSDSLGCEVMVGMYLILKAWMHPYGMRPDPDCGRDAVRPFRSHVLAPGPVPAQGQPLTSRALFVLELIEKKAGVMGQNGLRSINCNYLELEPLFF